MLPIPANVKVIIGTILVLAVGALQALGKLNPTWAWVGVATQTLTALELFFTLPQSAQDKMRALAKGPIGIAIVVFTVASSQVACISSAPTVPVTPENSAQVSTCQTTATEHNDFVIAGMAVGAASAITGGVAASEPDNKGLQQGLAIGAAIGAGVATFAAGGAGLTAASFTNGRCTDVVAPLPMKPGNAASGWPGSWPAPKVATLGGVS